MKYSYIEVSLMLSTATSMAYAFMFTNVVLAVLGIALISLLIAIRNYKQMQHDKTMKANGSKYNHFK